MFDPTTRLMMLQDRRHELTRSAAGHTAKALPARRHDGRRRSIAAVAAFARRVVRPGVTEGTAPVATPCAAPVGG